MEIKISVEAFNGETN
jgi:hypothetical protein